jgi:hypothetical protein
MATVSNTGPTEISTRETGRSQNQTDWAEWYMETETFMKACSLTVLSMGRVRETMRTVGIIEVNGPRAYRMDLDLSCTRIAQLLMEILRMGKNRDLELFVFTMIAYMRARFMRTRCTARENTRGPMAGGTSGSGT